MLLLFAAERYQITEPSVRVCKTYKSRQAETKQKTIEKQRYWESKGIIIPMSWSFLNVGRRYKIISKGKVAAFACSVFTKTYCISVISKALNGVNSFKRFRLNVFFQASNGYLFPICSIINVLELSFKSEF